MRFDQSMSCGLLKFYTWCNVRFFFNLNLRFEQGLSLSYANLGFLKLVPLPLHGDLCGIFSKGSSI